MGDIRKGTKFKTKTGKRGRILEVRGNRVKVRTGENEYWTSSRRLAEFAIFQGSEKVLVHQEPYRKPSLGGRRVEGSRYLAEDRGKPGLTPERERWYEPKGTLYGWKSSQSAPVRRSHLVDSVNQDGALKTYQRLNALRNVTTHKRTKRMASEDMKWIKRRYLKKRRK